MQFEIIPGGIADISVDAVVDIINPHSDAGIDARIHETARGGLFAARLQGGSAGLNAKHVIHAGMPDWKGGSHGEEQALASCYRKSLTLAKDYGCESIAFPLTATGDCGFPRSLALQTAIREIGDFLSENEMRVYLVVYGKEAFVLPEKLLKSVSGYIDENLIPGKTPAIFVPECAPEPRLAMLRYGAGKTPKRRYRQIEKDICRPGSLLPCGCGSVPMNPGDLGALLNDLDAGFSETLLRLIDRTGKKDSEIYKKANVDRKLFSKIRSNMDYRPSKTTALAFAFALELDIGETKDFIGRAGFALSRSSKFDVIVEYFLVNGNYNIFELNEVLFAFDQPLIGA